MPACSHSKYCLLYWKHPVLDNDWDGLTCGKQCKAWTLVCLSTILILNIYKFFYFLLKESDNWDKKKK